MTEREPQIKTGRRLLLALLLLPLLAFVANLAGIQLRDTMGIRAPTVEVALTGLLCGAVAAWPAQWLLLRMAWMHRLCMARAFRGIAIGFGLLAWGGYGLILLSVLFWGSVEEHSEFGTPASSPSDCGQSALIKRRTHCQGRDHSFLQGRLYYLMGEGEADIETCRHFLKATHRVKPSDDSASQWHNHQRECAESEPALWHEEPCGPLGIGKGYRCFVCSRFASTGDWYREMIALSRDCRQVRTYSAANVELKDVPARVRAGDAAAHKSRR